MSNFKNLLEKKTGLRDSFCEIPAFEPSPDYLFTKVISSFKNLDTKKM